MLQLQQPPQQLLHPQVQAHPVLNQQQFAPLQQNMQNQQQITPVQPGPDPALVAQQQQVTPVQPVPDPAHVAQPQQAAGDQNSEPKKQTGRNNRALSKSPNRSATHITGQHRPGQQSRLQQGQRDVDRQHRVPALPPRSQRETEMRKAELAMARRQHGRENMSNHRKEYMDRTSQGPRLFTRDQRRQIDMAPTDPNSSRATKEDLRLAFESRGYESRRHLHDRSPRRSSREVPRSSREEQRRRHPSVDRHREHRRDRHEQSYKGYERRRSAGRNDRSKEHQRKSRSRSPRTKTSKDGHLTKDNPSPDEIQRMRDILKRYDGPRAEPEQNPHRMQEQTRQVVDHRRMLDHPRPAADLPPTPLSSWSSMTYQPPMPTPYMQQPAYVQRHPNAPQHAHMMHNQQQDDDAVITAAIMAARFCMFLNTFMPRVTPLP